MPLAERARAALDDAFLRRAVRFTADRLRDRKAEATSALGDWEEWRERGRAIRAHSIANLDALLDVFRAKLEAAGGTIHFAADADEAARIAGGIARSRHARLAVKSKSMVSEEVGLNHRFAEIGIDSVETDLGEWIVQLAKEMPSHIILPAIHKSRAQIRALFERNGAGPLTDDTRTLAAYARRTLRERFLAADLGVTGCNFAIAETGSVAIFTNEGNGRMVTTLPGTHIVMMGMERIVPTWADLDVMASLLPRSATGQKITTYLNVLTGPAADGEIDGPRALHVIVLDNGRSRQLGDPEFQSILHCIRCGACLNVCPVYRQVGGHAYGAVYPGPIGAALMPLLDPTDPRSTELADASSLCGACTEACPVKIPLHEMLVHLRRRNVESGRSSAAERIGLALFARAVRAPRIFALAGRLARWAARRRIPFLLRPIAGWRRHRELPDPPRRAFHDLWRDLDANP